ncbi:glycosyltransferase family 4 protein [Spirosoma rhododendri]|uniref:Glycosyltransferase family 4 protein n=1 Tax=Spirosoma rhododendri TaxID=2728024 RepID=A0A7L5DV38_9BACT|nr:glycosyltransferase family 4 protein [Spirosoma rhododendri]QJD80458.1 glycosyltransferase family 4 protein [Spirosoma rhododendri]
MNVLIATYLATNSPSGVVTYTQTLTRDLMANGVGVQVIDAGSTPVGWRKFLGLAKRLMRPLGGTFAAFYDEFAYFTGVYLAARRLKNTGIELIHAQDPRSGAAARLALDSSVPVVLTCHFNDDPVSELVSVFSLGPRVKRVLTNWYVYLFSHIRHYVFVSNYAYTSSKQFLPATIDKRVLRNSVQLAYTPRRHDTGEGPLIISNVGYLDERKNQQLLLAIGRELLLRGKPDFRIWLIGDGPKRAEYEALAEQWQLSGHVTFYGRQSAPWELVAQSDLYVHTALNDNCPYALIEAMAVGVPVVALPSGGIPEMVPNGLGLLAWKTAPELADELLAYADADRRQQIAEQQAAYADRVFNHQRNLAELLAYYQQLTGSESSPAPAPIPVLS